jgi:molybdenum storage protein
MTSDLLTELGEKLVRGSLTDDELLRQTDIGPVVQILPDANVVKIGGQSMIDRGRSAVLPFLDELAENLGRHKMILA